MTAGYLYVLQNKSFENYVVKIGFTTRAPDVRAREIFSGATGIPEPFDVAFVCNVGDCKAAEKIVHSRLAPYRIHKSREFFQISPNVARSIIQDTCKKINAKFGTVDLPPILIEKTDKLENSFLPICFSEQFFPGEQLPFRIEVNRITMSPSGTSTLSDSQIDRISILRSIFLEVFLDSNGEWLTDFSRDHNPESEIIIWEHIAKAFLKVDQVQYFDSWQKSEAFELLVVRSNKSNKETRKEVQCKYFTKRAIDLILANYKLDPRPIRVQYRKSSKITVVPSKIGSLIRAAYRSS